MSPEIMVANRGEWPAELRWEKYPEMQAAIVSVIEDEEIAEVICYCFKAETAEHIAAMLDR